jgi:acetylornithine deacetylase
MLMRSLDVIDHEYVVDLLKDLVATNSVNPTVGRGTGEIAISNLILDRLVSIGKLEVHRQPVTDTRSNVIAILRGSSGGRSLMLNGHMDTVGTDRMTIDPFAPVEENGRLHGRGACDMKGALAAMIGSAKCLVDSGSRLRGDLVLAFVIDEECMSVGTRKLVQEYKADAAIVGEPTGMKVAIAHKGFVWIEVETKGKAAHGSIPEKGVDAIADTAKIISGLEGFQQRLAARTHPILGTPKVHSSTIEGGTDWSIIPDRCILRLERRTLPGESTSSVMREIREILDMIKLKNPEFNAVARSLYDVPPLETASGEAIVDLLRRAVSDVSGEQQTPIGVPYWTDGAVLSHSAAIPTCIFGPGDIGVAHSADEYVNLRDVLNSAEVYRRVSERFCS